MSTMPRRLLLAFAAAFVVAHAATAAAQDAYRIAVLPGAMWIDDEQARDDLVEESAYLVEDFGPFSVSRTYDLAGIVGSRTAADVAECGNDVACYASELDDGDFEYTLVVSIDQTDEAVFVQYQLIDLDAGALLAESIATLPTTTSFAHLLVPCHETLRATPAGGSAEPIASYVEVEVDRTPTPAPPIIPRAPAPRARASVADDGPVHGSLGRAGRAVAFSGGGVVALGILMGFAADDTQQALQSDAHSTSEIDDLQSTGRTQQTIANLALGVGAAAIITGVSLVIVDRGREDDARGLRVQVSGGPARVSLGARW